MLDKQYNLRSHKMQSVPDQNQTLSQSPIESDKLGIKQDMQTGYLGKAQSHTGINHIFNYFQPANLMAAQNSNKLTHLRVADAMDIDPDSIEAKRQLFASIESGSILTAAAEKAFQVLGPNFKLEKPLSFFVYDTETNRLFGDVSQLGWIRLDIHAFDDIRADCQNIVLPPTFMTHGAERVHKLSLGWIKEQHKQGLTTSQEEAAFRWLEHAMGSQSIIGFNLLYDLNAMKRLFHYSGIEARKVDTLFNKLTQNLAIDAQDYLLRIDPFTRQQHYLPFSDTKKSRMFAETEFENHYPDGQPITYMPNRKLVSYAQYFLGMKTQGAHDALFDCVVTIGSFVQALALRNETLQNENLSDQIENPLSHYNRTMRTSDSLIKRISSSAPREKEVHPVYSKAADTILMQNPKLKTTPFIFKSTGQTIHRRHIIPKSKLAELLVLNGDMHQQNKLYQNILLHPNFSALAKDHLSPQALNFYQSINALLQNQKISQSFFTKNTFNLLKNIEKTQSEGIPLRYFDRGLAAEMIQNLPYSDSIQKAGAVSQEQAHQVLTAVLFSFFHSFEFNQFIGKGADNMLAGKVFHELEKHEAATLHAIKEAKNQIQVKKIIQQWLVNLEQSLAATVFQKNPVEILETDMDQIPSSQKTSSDEIFYSLEQNHADIQFLDIFFDAEPATNAQNSNDIRALEQTRAQTLAIIDQFLEVTGHQTGRQLTFKDQSAFQTFHNAKADLIKASNAQQILKSINSFYSELPKYKHNLNNADLYQADKALLLSYLTRLTSYYSVKPEILNTLQDFQPLEKGDTPLNHFKKSAIGFVKSIMDSTSIDLSQASAGALQNSTLLRLINDIENQPKNLESATAFFHGFMDAEQDMAARLKVNRQINPLAPLQTDYMDFLY